MVETISRLDGLMEDFLQMMRNSSKPPQQHQQSPCFIGDGANDNVADTDCSSSPLFYPAQPFDILNERWIRITIATIYGPFFRS